MNQWLWALVFSACFGFVLAASRVVTLGRVTRQYSARSLGLDGNPRISDVLAALEEKGRPRPGWNAFVQNLSDWGFWRIFFVLWAGTSAFFYLICSSLLLAIQIFIQA
jgi:hypothetical protein